MKTGWSWQTHHIKLTGQIEDRWCLWFKITAPSLPQDTLSQTQKGHKHIKSLSNDNTACWTELTDIGRWKHRSKYKSNSIQCIQYKLHDRARTTSTMLNEIYFYISQHCIKTIISFEIKITLFLEDLPGHFEKASCACGSWQNERRVTRLAELSVVLTSFRFPVYSMLLFFTTKQWAFLKLWINLESWPQIFVFVVKTHVLESDGALNSQEHEIQNIMKCIAHSYLFPCHVRI